MSGKTWIPLDVKIHWFSFLSAKDLANAQRVCRSWVSLVAKTADAEITSALAAEPPNLSRAGKLKFLHRLQNATDKENMGYLLTWAAGNREYTPFLHKLLLLRDVIREDFGLPGGLHETSRPDAFADSDEDVRALFTYRTGKAIIEAPPGAPPNPIPPGVDLVSIPPLVMAAQRGNVDAIHLLLLFGEGVHARRKTNDNALCLAVQQGNILAVAALLGRVPLRPPKHPGHIAKRLGLIRPVHRVYGPAFTYNSGLSQGPHNVPAAVAAAKIRAEIASAHGISTSTGTRASASAANALTSGAATGHGSVPGSMPTANNGAKSAVSVASITNASLGMNIPAVEAQLCQTEAFEHDGRYRSWCRGYRMGTFWSSYDTALAAWEALHGPIGADADLPFMNNNGGGGGNSSGGGGRMGAANASVRLPAGNSSSSGGRGGVNVNGIFYSHGRQPSKGGGTEARQQSGPYRLGITVNLVNLPARLDVMVAPGSVPFGPQLHQKAIMSAYAAQALLVSRLPPNLLLPNASRVRPRGFIHPRLPAPVDYGQIASDSIAVKVRLNVGPNERTPLHVAAALGRTEIAYLLLSHHDPVKAISGEVPEIPKKDADGDNSTPAAAGGGGGNGQQGGGGGGNNNVTVPAPPAAAIPGGAAAAQAMAAANAAGAAAAPGINGAPAAPQAAAAPVIIPAHVLAAKAALSAIAQATASALAVPVEALTSVNTARKEEILGELMGERRDRVDVDACPSGSHTPLCLACERGDDRLASLLLHWGADVNRPGRKEARPILVAAMAGHEHILRLLLRSSCEMSAAKAVAAAIAEIQARRDEIGTALLAGPDEGISRAGSKKASSKSNGLRKLGSTSRSNGGFDTDADADEDDDDRSGSDADDGDKENYHAAAPSFTLSARKRSATRRLRRQGSESASSDAVFTLLGLGSLDQAIKTAVDRSAAMGLTAPGQVGSGRDGGIGSGIGGNNSKKDTAATKAMGSTIAVQSGSRKAGGAGGKGGKARDARRPEEASIDTCEPSVIAALAAAASATGSIDEFGSAVPPRPAPYDINTMYLPPDEAALGVPLSGPAAVTYQRLGGSNSAAAGRLGASRGKLAAILALAGGSGGVNGTRSFRSGSSSGSALDNGSSPFASGGDQSEADATAAELLSFPTAASFTEIVHATESFRTHTKAAVFTVINKSRIASGTGSLPGRPSLEVDTGDESGYSALFIMSCAGKLDSVQLLVAAGADCTLATKRGKTPIYGAVEKQAYDVVEFLMPRYTAMQLRQNTTYGTNVIHAANKAGNSRIRDMLQGYCVDYDTRLAKQIKREAAERRKAMWGDGDGGSGEGGGVVGSTGTGGAIGEGSEAANHLAKLRRMAEAARKKQEEKSWALLAKMQGGTPAAAQASAAAGGGGGDREGERKAGDDDTDVDSDVEGRGAGRGRGASKAPGGAGSPYNSGKKAKQQQSRAKSEAPSSSKPAPSSSSTAASNTNSKPPKAGGGERGRSIAPRSSTAASGASRASSVASSSRGSVTGGAADGNDEAASAYSSDAGGDEESKSARDRTGKESSSSAQQRGRSTDAAARKGGLNGANGAGGILLSRLAAAAAEARAQQEARERQRLENAAAARGGIPASVYAAAAAAAAAASAGAAGSPRAPSHAPSGGKGGASEASAAVSPYARRLDGTISPQAAAVVMGKGSPGRSATKQQQVGMGTQVLPSPTAAGAGAADDDSSAAAASSFSSAAAAAATSSVFERLAARAREMEARRKQAEEAAIKRTMSLATPDLASAAFGGGINAAAGAAAASGGQPDRRGGAGNNAAIKPSSGQQHQHPQRGKSLGPVVGAGSANHHQQHQAVRRDSDAASALSAASLSSRLSEVAADGGVHTARSGASSSAAGPNHQRHSNNALNTSTGSLDTSTASAGGARKYGGSSAAEMRASARAEVSSSSASAAAAHDAASGAAGGSGDTRARRAAYFDRLLRSQSSDGTGDGEQVTAAIDSGRGVSPMRSPPRPSGSANSNHSVGSYASYDNNDHHQNHHQQQHGGGAVNSSTPKVKRTAYSASAARDASPLPATRTNNNSSNYDGDAYTGSNVADRSPGAASDPGQMLQRHRGAASANDVLGRNRTSNNNNIGDHSDDRSGSAGYRPPIKPTQMFAEQAAPSIDPSSPLGRMLADAGLAPHGATSAQPGSGGRGGRASPGSASGGRGSGGAAGSGGKASLLASALGMPQQQQQTNNSNVYAQLMTKGLVPTASGNSFVRARESMQLKTAAVGVSLPFDFPATGSAADGSSGGGGGGGIGLNGLTREEVAAREERNRAREMAKLDRVRRAREELEARAREMEATAAAAHAAANAATSLKLAAAAYGNAAGGAGSAGGAAGHKKKKSAAF